MYVAVKGGEARHRQRPSPARRSRGAATGRAARSRSTQIVEQLALAVDRVMGEGSLYDRELAALAIKQARGDLIEAIFLLRAYRTTLPRFGSREPVDTGAMQVATAHLGDLQGSAGRPGAGPDLRLHPPAARSRSWPARLTCRAAGCRRGAVQRNAARHRHPRPRGPDRADRRSGRGRAGRRPHARAAEFPADRDVRLQALARGDEGFLLALGYSTQRGYGRTHPFVGEIRIGEVEVEFVRRGARLCRAARPRSRVTECQMVNQFKGSATDAAAVHPRLRAGVRPERAQGDGDGAGRPRAARARARRGGHRAGAGRGIRASRIPTTSRRPASSST